MVDNSSAELQPGCQWGKERMAIQETKMAAVEKAIQDIKTNDLVHIIEKLEKTQDRITAVLGISVVLALTAGAQVALYFLGV